MYANIEFRSAVHAERSARFQAEARAERFAAQARAARAPGSDRGRNADHRIRRAIGRSIVRFGERIAADPADLSPAAGAR